MRSARPTAPPIATTADVAGLRGMTRDKSAVSCADGRVWGLTAAADGSARTSVGVVTAPEGSNLLGFRDLGLGSPSHAIDPRLPLPRVTLRTAIERRVDDAGFRARAGLARVRRPDLPVDEAKVVVGTGRSGTTWLMEVLGSDPRTLPVFEPLHGWRTPASELTSIGGFHALDRHAHHPELEAYLRRVFQGRMLNRWTVRDASVRQILGAERAVAKMIRMCAAVGWFEATFPSIPVVAVVRHPCAVVASMARAEGRWELPPTFLREYARAALGVDADELIGDDGDDDLVRYATLWAIDNAALLRNSSPERTLIVGFEELLAAPRVQLERVAAHLGLDLDLDRIDLTRASSTTGRAGQVPGADQLGRWRNRLDDRHIARTLDIARQAGAVGITDDPMPDFDTMRAVQAGH